MNGERQPSQGLPIKLLDGLASLMAWAAEPWSAPSHKALTHLSDFTFGSEPCLNPSLVWAGDLLACVAGARDVRHWRVGALVPFFGLPSFYPTHQKYASVMCARAYLLSRSTLIARWPWPRCCPEGRAATCYTSRRYCTHWPGFFGLGRPDFRFGGGGSIEPSGRTPPTPPKRAQLTRTPKTYRV